MQGFTGALGLHTAALGMYASGIHQEHVSIWLVELADRHLRAAIVMASRVGCGA